ncbi:MAG TPA: hypothetical protein VFZ21_12865 [Gemmatimonadaceae bacterium]|nr:hypothetical protein [Gemmatimonadaceae bacterium]
MTSRLLHLTTMLLLPGLLLPAARGAGQAPPPPDSARDTTAETTAQRARILTGTWEGVIRLDSAWQLPERASARSTAARVRFQPVGNAPSPVMSSRSVHPGTFEIEFDRFGFTLSTRDALGWSVRGDSMRAVLNPAVSHGTVELHGVFRGDTIVGQWRYLSDPGGARGTFVLRRAASGAQDAHATVRGDMHALGSDPRPVEVRLHAPADAEDGVSTRHGSGHVGVPERTVAKPGPGAGHSPFHRW